MPKLSLIRDKTEKFVAEICGETITGRYHPAGMTGERLDVVNELMASGDIHKANAQAVSEVVTEWDLLGEDDKPIPLDDVEQLRILVPSRILSVVLSGVAEAQRPPDRKSEASKGSFGREDE